MVSDILRQLLIATQTLLNKSTSLHVHAKLYGPGCALGRRFETVPWNI
jgi:hypothetical protein